MRTWAKAIADLPRLGLGGGAKQHQTKGISELAALPQNYPYVIYDRVLSKDEIGPYW